MRGGRAGAGLRFLKNSRCVIAGGGAAGFFAAIACAEANPGASVTLCEATAHVLAKVRISGGGRCNVTHACFEPRDLAARFPRGGRELIGPFSRWQPRDTIAWFEERGIALKTEEDGRVFPVSDNSATIVDCLLRGVEKAGVEVRTSCALRAVESAGTGFSVEITGGETLLCDRLLLATGGGRSSAGFATAAILGHTIEPLVASLFTFHIRDSRLQGLEGVSAADVSARIPGTHFESRGPILVTHHGLSGPAVLKLSAWAAPELAERDYSFPFQVDWSGGRGKSAVAAELEGGRTAHPKRQISTSNPFGLPARLWERLIVAAGISPQAPWTTVPKAALAALAAQVTASEFAVAGKSLNKEEFVTCGGVRLSEVDFRTMESRIRPGLHFAGEILDIDGLTGGFNFQAAWTTGWLAGRAMGRS